MTKSSRIKIARQLLYCAKMVLDADKIIASATTSEQRKKCWENINFVRDHFHLPELQDDIIQTDFDDEETIESDGSRKQNPDAHHLWGIINPSLNDAIVQNRIRREKLDAIVRNHDLDNINSVSELQNADFDKWQMAIIYEILRTKRETKSNHRIIHKKFLKQKTVVWNSCLRKLRHIDRYNDFFKYLQQIFFEYKIPLERIEEVKKVIYKKLRSWKDDPPIPRYKIISTPTQPMQDQ